MISPQRTKGPSRREAPLVSPPTCPVALQRQAFFTGILPPQPPGFTLSLSLKGSPQFHDPNNMTKFTMTQTAVRVEKLLCCPQVEQNILQLWLLFDTHETQTHSGLGVVQLTLKHQDSSRYRDED